MQTSKASYKEKSTKKVGKVSFYKMKRDDKLNTKNRKELRRNKRQEYSDLYI